MLQRLRHFIQLPSGDYLRSGQVSQQQAKCRCTCGNGTLAADNFLARIVAYYRAHRPRNGHEEPKRGATWNEREDDDGYAEEAITRGGT